VLEEEVYGKGLPLVIANTNASWKREKELFSFDWLKKNIGKSLIRPKDCVTHKELSTTWTCIEYLDYLNLPKEKRNPSRAYGREVTCPPQWHEVISQKLPAFAAHGENDLMAENLKELRSDTMTICIGGEDTLLPGHMDHLVTVGNSLMVCADDDAYALWMFVPSEDKDKAANFWKKQNGSLYTENLFLSIDQLSKAPFTIYVLEQRLGDFVITPSGSPYQVINKVNRTSLNQLIQIRMENLLKLVGILYHIKLYKIAIILSRYTVALENQRHTKSRQ
jgi:hypothetical protein